MKSQHEQKALFVRLEPGVYDEFKELCERLGSSMSAQGRNLVHEFLSGFRTLHPLSSMTIEDLVSMAGAYHSKVESILVELQSRGIKWYPRNEQPKE